MECSDGRIRKYVNTKDVSDNQLTILPAFFQPLTSIIIHTTYVELVDFEKQKFRFSNISYMLNLTIFFSLSYFNKAHYFKRRKPFPNSKAKPTLNTKIHMQNLKTVIGK